MHVPTIVHTITCAPKSGACIFCQPGKRVVGLLLATFALLLIALLRSVIFEIVVIVNRQRDGSLKNLRERDHNDEYDIKQGELGG